MKIKKENAIKREENLLFLLQNSFFSFYYTVVILNQKYFYDSSPISDNQSTRELSCIKVLSFM